MAFASLYDVCTHDSRCPAVSSVTGGVAICMTSSSRREPGWTVCAIPRRLGGGGEYRPKRATDFHAGVVGRTQAIDTRRPLVGAKRLAFLDISRAPVGIGKARRASVKDDGGDCRGKGLTPASPVESHRGMQMLREKMCIREP